MSEANAATAGTGDVTPDVAILGGGRMGEALLAGLLRGGRTPADIVVSERYPERGAQLASGYGVQVVSPAVAAAAGVLVVAVKPHDVRALLDELAPSIRPDHLVVSVAAGIGSGDIESALGRRVAVVRCMPNTPALVGEGMTGLAPGRHATGDDLDRAEALLGVVGKVARVTEAQLDAVTAVSGSGPAYFFLMVEAMVEAGVLLGLPRPLATELVVQTALGSAVMMRDSGDTPGLLREAVTSPAGTTAAGLRELEAHGVRAALTAAVEAAARRSVELRG